MEEKVKTIIVEMVETGLVTTEELVDKVLKAISEEIGKVENPYPDDRYHVAQRIAYEEACQDILSLLCSK